ncbi:hypothetical protein AUC70_05640 [Methyloceanibacter stevinii]|uniref:DUF6998 domain-containing protein n=1 Tax=Methyloceanibacter stevinii TaxID=1774970 RepID=A0A1E3VNT9_9HYPH|nr:hypothetical protein [Methyloceanibacter stevinii]ODR95190.1 hypothetical protein AUC70_05640 [Methyloceanibacter stevinii]
MALKLSSKTNSQLLALIADCQNELRSRDVIQSANIVGDLAETYVCSALGLKRQGKSAKGVDAVGPDGTRYEIKGRRLTPWNKSRQLSALRGLDQKPFDVLAGVLFDERFQVQRAALIPYQVVRKRAGPMPRVNAHRFLLKDIVWDMPGVIDITDNVRKAEQAL